MLNFINQLSSLSRHTKITLQVILDAGFILLSFLAAMLFRLESFSFIETPELWGAIGLTMFATLIVLAQLGLYRVLVRFINGKILIIAGKSSVIAACTLYLVNFAMGAGIPRSVPIIFAVLIFLSVGGIRFVARAYFRSPQNLNKQSIIIYGAGAAGRQLLNSLFHGPEFAPVAFVDDNPRLQNMYVGGLRVYAPSEVAEVAASKRSKVILLAIPSLSRNRRREIVKDLEDLQIEIKTIPGIAEIISGKAEISELRNVSPEDLLGRDTVAPNAELLGKNVRDQVVMVSGAGGSIGSELCRQLISQSPSTLVLYEVSEFALYAIEAELREVINETRAPITIIPILGSVQQKRRLESAIQAFRVDTIYHAAAYKHVPLVEENVVEGIRNNVFGTLAIASAAKKLGVKNFILISTDKAVRPTNVMGATKRIAELICQALALESSNTVFSMVRFGNVLGSSGSVIPRFSKQIEAGGPITVTHRDITRYFMTIPEAAQLVIQAGAMAQGGDVFVLDMGKPVKIIELAVSMVKLHGLVPYFADEPEEATSEQGDIQISVTGLRKGEKLYEELLIGGNPAPTLHPRILSASERSLQMDQLGPLLDDMLGACEHFDLPNLLKLLHELPIEFTPDSTETSDLLWGALKGAKEDFNSLTQSK